MTSSQYKTTYATVEIKVFGQTFRFTNWTGVVPNFTSIPNMKVEYVKFTGTLQEDEAELVIPVEFDQGLFDLVGPVGTVAVAEVTIIEFELNSAGAVVDTIVMFGGEVYSVTDNYRGAPGQSRYLLQSTKSRIDQPLGAQCGPLCPWRLFDDNCQVVKDDFTYPVTIVSYDAANRNVSVLGAPSGPDKLFLRGYFILNGLVIGIRHWTSDDPTTFWVDRTVPNHWIGELVSAVGGCDNQIDTCRTVYDNEHRNGAIGLAMLKYDPQFETGGST